MFSPTQLQITFGSDAVNTGPASVARRQSGLHRQQPRGALMRACGLRWLTPAGGATSLVMVKVEGVQNLHSLDSYGGPLGVECTCGRRALVPPEALGAHSGNMREIRSLRFVCRECGSRRWTGFIFGRHDDALGWARQVLHRV